MTVKEMIDKLSQLPPTLRVSRSSKASNHLALNPEILSAVEVVVKSENRTVKVDGQTVTLAETVIIL